MPACEALSDARAGDVDEVAHFEDFVELELLAGTVLLHVLNLSAQRALSLHSKNPPQSFVWHPYSAFYLTLNSLRCRNAGASAFLRWFSSGFVIFRSGTPS